MEDQSAVADAIIKSSGITETERYLEELCEKNFLSLWSYPRPFRDQGGNKELCDLLVVMGNDVIIFSDKHCELTTKKPLDVAWQRWFKSAVHAGAKQAWGAERWLREHPQRVFVDPECSRLLPVIIPSPEVARYHLVVTVHGISAPCRALLGGTGSLMMKTDVTGTAAHSEPFVIGDLDPSKSFIHVFDEATLAIVMSTLDTTPDFVRYLREKERVCRAHTLICAGEENLLALYLSRLDDRGEHALVIDSDVDGVLIEHSCWDDFAASEERRAQLQHDQVSYVWDRLIERFASHALDGTQYHATEPALSSSETILRLLAAESRFRRRILSAALLETVHTTRRDQRRLRVIPSQSDSESMYVFLLFPWNEDRPEQENRFFRRKYLEACLVVAKMKYPLALDVVGIATESGPETGHRSEDALYFDARSWSADDDDRARSLQQDWNILLNEQASDRHVEEYPSGFTGRPNASRRPKIPRNSPCPCGSGQKYKRCHGR